MNIKLFEVRDSMTFIPCFGILMVSEPSTAAMSGPMIESLNAEEFLLHRSGFVFVYPLVMFGRLEGGECQYDPYCWRGRSRTMARAHKFVAENWNDLQSGAVIDVEFIFGERAKPKESESGR